MMGAFVPLGLLTGYFLAYSIRSNSKTQDAFKGLIGILGLIGGAAMIFLLRDFVLIRDGTAGYGLGAVIGFFAYVAISVVLSSVYSNRLHAAVVAGSEPVMGWALWAELLAKVLLGEDLRPPRSKP